MDTTISVSKHIDHQFCLFTFIYFIFIASLSSGSVPSDIPERLQTEFKLLDLFLDDLKVWTRTAKKALIERRGSAASSTGEESPSIGTDYVDMWRINLI